MADTITCKLKCDKCKTEFDWTGIAVNDKSTIVKAVCPKCYNQITVEFPQPPVQVDMLKEDGTPGPYTLSSRPLSPQEVADGVTEILKPEDPE